MSTGLGERRRLPIGAEQARFRMPHHLPEGCIGRAQCLPCQDRRDTTTHILRLAFENKRIVLKLTLATHLEYDWDEGVRTAEISFLLSLLQDIVTKKADGGALSLAALRLSTAQCGSAFASGPARLPPRLICSLRRRLLRALPSRGTRKLTGLSRHKRPAPRKRVPSIYSTVPKTSLAPCYPRLAAGQGFRSGASLL